MSEAKPFCISEKEVWEAYERVKANQGAAGVDEQSIADLEIRLRQNLYKIWNRMSSGSYFPPLVFTGEPKTNREKRRLSLQTVSDRIAQMVVKARLELEVDPAFRLSSHVYRPGRSSLEAVGRARERSGRSDRIVDLDIRGILDNIDQKLLMRAVKEHTRETWIVLYMERWLQATNREEDGFLTRSRRRTPPGGLTSPLLSALLLHYAFDRWIAAKYPHVKFERSADDAIAFCTTEVEAEEVRLAMAARLAEVGWGFIPSPRRSRTASEFTRHDQAINLR